MLQRFVKQFGSELYYEHLDACSEPAGITLPSIGPGKCFLLVPADSNALHGLSFAFEHSTHCSFVSTVPNCKLQTTDCPRQSPIEPTERTAPKQNWAASGVKNDKTNGCAGLAHTFMFWPGFGVATIDCPYFVAVQFLKVHISNGNCLQVLWFWILIYQMHPFFTKVK